MSLESLRHIQISAPGLSAISYDETEKITNNLKAKKAIGIDKIPNEILKINDVKYVMHKMFNAFFNTSMLPSIWLKALIVPVPKSSTKDPYIPLNYRGISLLSCVYKAYSGILNNRIKTYMEDRNWFVEEQNGFRKGRSCQDHIYTLSSIIRNRQNEKKHTYAAFIDFQKAFEWIDRDLLMYKLLINDIDGKIYHSVKNMYTNTSSAIRLNEHITDWFPCTSGVRQGDVLSTTLFSIFLNDLAVEIKNLNVGIDITPETQVSLLMYADDIVLLAENPDNLQKMLDNLHDWCTKWRMKTNQSKSQIVHFRPSRCNRTNFEFKIANQKLDIVDQYKYLGVLLNEYLDFSHTASLLSASASRALGAIIGKTKKLREVGFNTFSKMFDTCVNTILNYSSEIWGFKDYKCCDDVQYRAIRYFLGLHRFTPLLSLRGEMGWDSLQQLRWLCIARYWSRLLKMDPSRLTRILFEWEYEYTTNASKSNWCSEVRSIFLNSDLLYIYIRTKLLVTPKMCLFAYLTTINKFGSMILRQSPN